MWRINKERDPEIPVKRRKHLHQPVQREPPEVRVANAREVRRRKTGQSSGSADREGALVQQHDDACREDRLCDYGSQYGASRSDGAFSGFPETTAVSPLRFTIATGPAPSELDDPHSAPYRSMRRLAPGVSRKEVSRWVRSPKIQIQCQAPPRAVQVLKNLYLF